MRGVFDGREVEPARPRRDAELTLSSGTLLGIFFALVLICGLCFGLGYTVGRHGSQDSSAAASLADAQTTMPQNASAPKPSANGQNEVAASAETADTAQPAPVADSTASAATDTGSPAASQNTEPAPASSASDEPSQIRPAQDSPAQARPAVIAAANPPQAAQSSAVPVASPKVQPAFPPAPVLMVQIAAVSHQEDADVLVDALRKRGYAVTAHREPLDNLIHVRIGPFSSRDEADRWRMKLLNDGYNAIIQP
jgi:DedD protein